MNWPAVGEDVGGAIAFVGVQRSRIKIGYAGAGY